METTLIKMFREKYFERSPFKVLILEYLLVLFFLYLSGELINRNVNERIIGLILHLLRWTFASFLVWIFLKVNGSKIYFCVEQRKKKLIASTVIGLSYQILNKLYIDNYLSKLFPQGKTNFSGILRYIQLTTFADKAITIIFVGIIAPFAEELCYRFFLLSETIRILDKRTTKQLKFEIPLMIFLQAFLFGVVHVYQGVYAGVGAFLLAIVLGVVYYYTKNVWIITILHTLGNVIAMIRNGL